MNKQLIQQAIGNNQQAVTTIQGSFPLGMPQHLIKKFQLINSLPKNTLDNLPKITQRQVRSLMLKHAPLNEIEEFIEFVLEFINPKASETEMMMLCKVLYDFAIECPLTLEEMKEALKMASRSELSICINGKEEIIRLYREIDRLKLEDLCVGYTNYRNEHFQYKKGLKELRLALHPPKEITPQEIQQENEQAFLDFIEQYKKTKKLPKFTVWFYNALDRKQLVKPFGDLLSPQEKDQMRKEVLVLLSEELSTTDKARYKLFKEALSDFKNHQNEDKEPILGIKKQVAVKWYMKKNYPHDGNEIIK